MMNQSTTPTIKLPWQQAELTQQLAADIQALLHTYYNRQPIYLMGLDDDTAVHAIQTIQAQADLLATTITG